MIKFKEWYRREGFLQFLLGAPLMEPGGWPFVLIAWLCLLWVIAETYLFFTTP